MLQKMTAGCKPHKTDNTNHKCADAALAMRKCILKALAPLTNEANDQRPARVQAIANLIFPYKGKAANNH
jgi:hypothetical protein